MAPENHAAYLTHKKAAPFEVKPAPYTPPGPNEVVIRVRACAINPADNAIQSLGMLLEIFPAILGCDVAGEVVAVGPWDTNAFDRGVQAFNDGSGDGLVAKKPYQIGDRVVGNADVLSQRDEVYCFSGFQEYAVLSKPMIAKVPEGVKFEEASVLPVAVNTAASCLFSKGMLGLELPLVDGKAERPGKGKTLIVWAASSSVGSMGVQLAAMAGYQVVGIASKKNHGLVKDCGAVACFDQNDADVVDQVASWLKEKKADVVGAYDGISREETIKPLCEILDRAGGRKFISAVFWGAEGHATHGVEVTTNFEHTVTKQNLAKPLWKVVEATLGDGRLKCLPPVDVVGHGLEKAQEAVDLIGKGVSAKKLAITL